MRRFSISLFAESSGEDVFSRPQQYSYLRPVKYNTGQMIVDALALAMGL